MLTTPAPDMLPTARLGYDLPEALIAATPAQPRDSARLLVVSRSDDSRLDLRCVRDLPDLLTPGDTLVVNDSRVIPARLIGARQSGGGKVEGLFLSARAPAEWFVMLKANRPLRPGDAIDLIGSEGAPSPYALTLQEREGPVWRATFSRTDADESAAPATAFDALERVGRTPLPPYILAARRRAGAQAPDAFDRVRYQTVYSREGRNQPALASVAAPTAGLHFTPTLLSALESRSIERVSIALGVGPGTFKPIETGFVEAHDMHEEWLSVSADAQRRLSQTRAAGGRIVAIGTTSARALESIPPISPHAPPMDIFKATRLLITPGHHWRNVDAMLTNFHLPRSTLLAMTAALFPGGVDRLLDIYSEAIRRRLRFYSYGDAMLILP